MGRYFYALVSAAVVTGAGGALSAGTLALPKGPARERIDAFVAAPGRELLERFGSAPLAPQVSRALRAADSKEVRKLKKLAASKASAAAETLGDRAEAVVGGAVPGFDAEQAAERIEKLAHLCNVSIWAVVGFALCLLGTVVLGVSSLKAAVVLGFKMAIFMVFLQAGLVFGGVAAFQAAKG